MLAAVSHLCGNRCSELSEIEEASRWNEKLQDKVAVITRGTSGTGLATARLFVEDGASAFILGRRQKELDEAVDGIGRDVRVKFENWRGRDGNDPSVDIAKDADQRF